MKIKKIFLVFFILTNLLYSLSEEIDEKKIGLILSGGGAKGFAHIGLLKVIDAEKIPIDYIVGTSMGSIIGGLYSMGYSANEIEEIILARDWLSYFNDSIAREDELIDNKEDKDKYAISVPIRNWKISIPKGAVKGQNVDKVLQELYLNAKDINDFSKLAIPFACVATNAETGEAVVFDKGYLPDAIRASMSLPGALDPIELNGKLLLDGGLANNFPASIALEMGANYLIGMEVLGDLQKKEKLNSAVAIMDQAIAYKRVDITKIEKSRVDILLSPRTEDYSIFSFSKAKEIIDEGERVARERINEFKELQNISKFEEKEKRKIKQIEKIELNDLKILGSKRISTETLEKIVNLSLPNELEEKDINNIIDKLYNLNIFDKVNYKIKGRSLEIIVEEKAEAEIKLGFNYNETTKGDIFVKFSRTGTNFMGNKMSLEALLGKDDALRMKSTWYIGPTNKFGWSLGANYANVEDYPLISNGIRLQDFNVDSLNLDFMIGTFLSNSQLFGFGIKKEYINIESKTLTTYNELAKYKNNYEIIYVKYLHDSRDDKYFPSEGVYVEALMNNYLGERIDDFSFANYKFKVDVPLVISDKNILSLGGEKHYIDEKNMSPIYIPTLGGIYSRQNSVTFWGLNPSEYISNNFSVIHGELKYEWKPFRYFIVRYNQAFLNPTEFNREKSIIGGGVGFEIKTPLGPIQLIASQSNKNSIMAYLNIGYNF